MSVPFLRRVTIALSWSVLAFCPQAATPALQLGAVSDGGELWHPPAPTELYEITRVVDGDTLHVLRDGELVKLRLLGVDTEEKISGRPNRSPLKPQTVYGEESAHWARRFFDGLADSEGTSRVGLLFPDGEERRDVYGRLLCHVLLPDGTDFNLLLVRQGRSPYFNKYGNSRLCHQAFRAAQEAARGERIGIWDPATNRAADPAAPSARRPYELLLPWWNARAEAIDAFRARRSHDPRHHVEAEDSAALAALADAPGATEPVVVFGSIERFFDERNGDRTVLFRSTGPKALRVRIPAAARARFESLELERSTEELRQNYFTVRGSLQRDSRGFRITTPEPEAWSLAGPQPEF